VKKIKQLKIRLKELERNHEKQADLMTDLLDYLMRVDINFKSNNTTFEGWYMRLMQLREKDKKRNDCLAARRTLEDAGYIVAVDEKSLDAEKLKKWIKISPIVDDDIPF